MKLMLYAAALALLTLSGAASAKPWWMRDTPSNDTDFLPPDVAFRVGAGIDGNALRVRWVIADGYYLYRQRIEVRAESPDLTVGPPNLPAGSVKTDPYLGRQEIYTQQVEASVPYTRSDFGAHPLQIKVTYQGCAEAGLCYPPITKVIFPTDRASGGAGQSQSTQDRPHRWEIIAIVTGVLAFLFAGVSLRRGRKLELPA